MLASTRRWRYTVGPTIPQKKTLWNFLLSCCCFLFLHVIFVLRPTLVVNQSHSSLLCDKPEGFLVEKNVHKYFFLFSCSCSVFLGNIVLYVGKGSQNLQNQSCTCSCCTTPTSVLTDQCGRVLAAETLKPRIRRTSGRWAQLLLCQCACRFSLPRDELEPLHCQTRRRDHKTLGLKSNHAFRKTYLNTAFSKPIINLVF